MLLAAGADVNGGKDRNGTPPPMTWALKNHSKPVIKQLLEYGASVPKLHEYSHTLREDKNLMQVFSYYRRKDKQKTAEAQQKEEQHGGGETNGTVNGSTEGGETDDAKMLENGENRMGKRRRKEQSVRMLSTYL